MLAKLFDRRHVAALFLIAILLFASGVYAETDSQNPIVKFLTDIEYTSQFRIEYDDNIFLTENREDDEFREVFSQTLLYRLPRDKYYFQWRYNGKYAYYNEEATGILGHTAHALYSYRPFEKFSIGARSDYNWLSDSTITQAIGDRVLALGYIQNTSSLQAKYEVVPNGVFTVDGFYQFLDVRDQHNDDYIDNKQHGVSGRFDFDFPENRYVGFMGLTHRKIDFGQISEKSGISRRAFVGVTEKFPALFDVTAEVGFENIRFANDANVDDDNIDFRMAFETTFSLYTKIKLGYTHNAKRPSLRTQYTQYAANLAELNFSHAINPKTSLYFDYTHERQRFDGSNRTIDSPYVDRKTHIHTIKCTLSRRLNSWLTTDLSYHYTKRDTDFAAEGYTNNKISAGITAKY